MIQLSVAMRTDLLAAAFRDANAAAQAALLPALLEQAPRIQRAIEGNLLELDVVDTGFSLAHVEIRESTDEAAPGVRVGFFSDSYEEAGHEFYIVFPVLGTRYVAPRDVLTPAIAGTQNELTAGVAVTLRKAIESAGGGAGSGA